MNVEKVEGGLSGKREGIKGAGGNKMVRGNEYGKNILYACIKCHIETNMYNYPHV